jgi:hypothetical protein
MVRSRWLYRKLRNFRAGIESDILARCTWRGLERFKALRLVLGRRLQPRAPHSPQADLNQIDRGEQQPATAG